MHSRMPRIRCRLCTGWNFSFRSRTIPVTPYRVSTGSFSRYSNREIRCQEATKRPTAGRTIRIRMISPTPPTVLSDQLIMPASRAPPSRISAAGERMQSITARATRLAFSSLVFRNAFASSILTVRVRLSGAVSCDTSVCSSSSFSR